VKTPVTSLQDLGKGRGSPQKMESAKKKKSPFLCKGGEAKGEKRARAAIAPCKKRKKKGGGGIRPTKLPLQDPKGPRSQRGGEGEKKKGRKKGSISVPSRFRRMGGKKKKKKLFVRGGGKKKKRKRVRAS